ncbi:MAG: hypothetical protein WCT32_02120 [Patescibacteria group bacterium]|jgi:hypothetical protein
MISENFVYLGALINLLGGASYIKDTIQGKIQPNRVSWGLWGIGVLVAFSAEISQGVGIQSLATFMVGFVPLLVFFASFVNKKAFWKITKFDLLCGALSVIGLILWRLTSIGNVAIMFSIFSDLMAGIPTLKKAYRYPESENWIEFMSSFISVTLAMLSLKNWSFAYFAFPLYIFFYDLTGVLLIKFKLGKRIESLRTASKQV